MAEDEEQGGTPQRGFPRGWLIASEYDPKQHLMNLKGKDYLNVQNRLLWFVRDQRAMIVAGLATVPYIIRSEIVELDQERGYAHFRTFVRDVLGNEATMYGSEERKDFGDFAEKASTKSLGRALSLLGYGTGFSPDMDEDERVVDAPRDHRQHSRQRVPEPPPPAVLATRPALAAAAPPTADAPSNITRLDSQVASEANQKSLAASLRTAGISGKIAAETFLMEALEREIDILRLASGTSDITVSEVRRVIAALAARNQARAEATAADVVPEGSL